MISASAVSQSGQTLETLKKKKSVCCVSIRKQCIFNHEVKTTESEIWLTSLYRMSPTSIIINRPTKRNRQINQLWPRKRTDHKKQTVNSVWFTHCTTRLYSFAGPSRKTSSAREMWSPPFSYDIFETKMIRSTPFRLTVYEYMRLQQRPIASELWALYNGMYHTEQQQKLSCA